MGLERKSNSVYTGRRYPKYIKNKRYLTALNSFIKGNSPIYNFHSVGKEVFYSLLLFAQSRGEHEVAEALCATPGLSLKEKQREEFTKYMKALGRAVVIPDSGDGCEGEDMNAFEDESVPDGFASDDGSNY